MEKAIEFIRNINSFMFFDTKKKKIYPILFIQSLICLLDNLYSNEFDHNNCD